MENKDWREEFEDKYCSFEISERVSKSDMLAIISFIESLLKSKQEEIEGEMDKMKKGLHEQGDDQMQFNCGYNFALVDLKPIISNLLK